MVIPHDIYAISTITGRKKIIRCTFAHTKESRNGKHTLIRKRIAQYLITGLAVLAFFFTFFHFFFVFVFIFVSSWRCTTLCSLNYIIHGFGAADSNSCAVRVHYRFLINIFFAFLQMNCYVHFVIR